MRHLMKLRLVEQTGETETSDILVIQGDPDAGTAPGDLRLDPARGFQQRYYWRLTPDSQGHPAWENLMASIRAIYRIEMVARPRRPRRPGASEEVLVPVPVALQELHRQLDLRRQGLVEQARFAAQSGQPVEIFQDLLYTLLASGAGRRTVRRARQVFRRAFPPGFSAGPAAGTPAGAPAGPFMLNAYQQESRQMTQEVKTVTRGALERRKRLQELGSIAEQELTGSDINPHFPDQLKRPHRNPLDYARL